MENEKHFLEQYGIHNKPEALDAAAKKEHLTGESNIVQNRSRRIQAYMERLEHIFLNPDPRTRRRNIEVMKPTIYDMAIINPSDFPESHFEFKKNLLRERGEGEVEFSDEQKREEIEHVRASQRKSLDGWIDYLSSDGCRYPTDIKYFAMQGVLRLGTFDTAKYSFTKRVKATTAPFAEIDREALSKVLGAMEAKRNHTSLTNYSSKLIALIEQGNGFGDMYGEVMRELDKEEDRSNLLSTTDGEWVTFAQGSDPQALVDALAGKRSNLCIADIGSASQYLSEGSVEIFFSHDQTQQPTVPRVAIALAEDKGGVYEVRGTHNKNEDVDPFIIESGVLTDRLKKLPKGEEYAFKDSCMKKMTALYRKCWSVNKKTGEKTYLNPVLTKEELMFLYEVDEPIQGFGYDEDSRIAELRETRDVAADILIIFECKPEQIARSSEDISDNTKAYIGKLESGIFKKLPESARHVYTSFPENKIHRQDIKIGGKSALQLLSEFEQAGIHMSRDAPGMLKSSEFIPGKDGEIVTLIRLTITDLGFTEKVTTDQIYKRAQELGLELCPAEVGPHYRLQYKNQPMDEWIYIGMKPITSLDGELSIFAVTAFENGLWLHDDYAEPDHEWDPEYEFVFRLRKEL